MKNGTVYSVKSVKVDYNQSLREMIEAGKYDWVNNNIIQENFPVQGEGVQKVELVLIHLNGRMKTKQVLEEFEKQNLRLSRLPELLAFGAKYPNIQKQFRIIALGSVWVNSSGDYRVPYLGGFQGGNGRSLRLGWGRNGWGNIWRFLAARV